MFQEITAQLRQYYREHPEEFPEIPGHKYWIVVFDSERKLVEKGAGRIPSATYEIMALSEGSEKVYSCFPL